MNGLERKDTVIRKDMLSFFCVARCQTAHDQLLTQWIENQLILLQRGKVLVILSGALKTEQ
jgi:hypothetical protein